MTAYRNFISDYPRRCGELLETFRHDVRGWREVTLMLSLASSGLIIPYERLKQSKTPHPSGDSEKYDNAREKLEILGKTTFLKSGFCMGNNSSWMIGKTSSISGDIEAWKFSKDLKSISAKKTFGSLIKVIRNALAHGNIFTKGNPIEHIVFLSSVQKGCDEKGRDEKFNFLQVSIEDFDYFIKAWFKFTQELNIPGWKPVITDAA